MPTTGGIRINRWTVERAVLASSLPAPSRLLMLILLTRVSNGTLVIPSQFAPSLTTLVAETGLARGSVANHLNRLEREGWLVRHRPSVAKARSEKARTGYSVTVPASARDGLVQEMDLSSASPGDGLAAENAQVATGLRGGLVQEMDLASPGDGLNPKYGPKSFKNTHQSSAPNGRRPKADEDPRFVEFYAAYPRKADRGAARRAWATAMRKHADPQVLINAAKSYAESRRGKDPRFTKHPSTWLNAEAWLNEPEHSRTGRTLPFDDEDYGSDF